MFTPKDDQQLKERNDFKSQDLCAATTNSNSSFKFTEEPAYTDSTMYTWLNNNGPYFDKQTNIAIPTKI